MAQQIGQAQSLQISANLDKAPLKHAIWYQYYKAKVMKQNNASENTDIYLKGTEDNPISAHIGK